MLCSKYIDLKVNRVVLVSSAPIAKFEVSRCWRCLRCGNYIKTWIQSYEFWKYELLCDLSQIVDTGGYCFFFNKHKMTKLTSRAILIMQAAKNKSINTSSSSSLLWNQTWKSSSTSPSSSANSSSFCTPIGRRNKSLV